MVKSVMIPIVILVVGGPCFTYLTSEVLSNTNAMKTSRHGSVLRFTGALSPGSTGHKWTSNTGL